MINQKKKIVRKIYLNPKKKIRMTIKRMITKKLTKRKLDQSRKKESINMQTGGMQMMKKIRKKKLLIVLQMQLKTVMCIKI
jgi:hypothetical protein